MPHVVVWNLSEEDFHQVMVWSLPGGDFHQPEGILKIEAALVVAIVDIHELELTPDDISFSFPQDPTISQALSNEVPVVIIVELLFDKPERTTEVRQYLARAIAEAFRAAVTWRKVCGVEVAVKRFNPEQDGFFSC